MATRPHTYKTFTNKKLDLIFVFAVAIVVLLTVYDYMKSREPEEKAPQGSMESLYIYIPKGEVKMVEKVLEVKLDTSAKHKADIIINLLKRQKCLSEKLTLYDFASDNDGIMYLNFSKDILDDKISAAREITMTYAIVNSFISNFKGIKKIQFLVEGQPAQTINGVISIYKPIEFNKDLLED